MENINFSNNKSISIGRLIITLFVLIVVITGGTFAWLTYSSKQSALVLTIGNINDTQIKLSPYEITGTMTPSTTYSGGVYSDVEVTKGDNKATSFALFYKINQLDPVLIEKGLSYTIIDTSINEDVNNDGKINDDDRTVKKGTFLALLNNNTTNIPEEVIILDTDTEASLSENTSVNYRVYLWVDSYFGNQNDIQNSTLDVELNASIGSVTISGTNAYNETLTATINDAVIDNTTTYSYQWYYVADDNENDDIPPPPTDGTAIEGATSSSYTIGKGLVGKYIYLVVTTSKGKTLSNVIETAVAARTIDVSKMTYGPLTKVYDGTTAAPSGFKVTVVNGSGLLSGDSLNLNYTGAVYNSANVANATSINVSGMSLSGTDAANYALSSTSYEKTGATITVKTLNLGAYSATYNGTKSFSRTFSTGIGSETLNLAYAPYSADVANYSYSTSAGSGKYTVSMANGTGTTSNYSIVSGGTFTINKANLTLSVAVTGTATYGETLTANVTNTDSASLSYQWYTNTSASTTGGTAISGATSSTYSITSSAFDSSYNGKYVYVVVTGTKANYNDKAVSDVTDATNNTTAMVAKRKITVTADSDSKTYDGSALTDSGCTLTSGTYAFSQTLNSCTMTSGSTITNAGSVANTINSVNLSSGNGYYDITKVAGTLTISKKSLSIGTHSATYNGTKSYTRTFSTGIGSETVTLTYAPYAKTVGSYSYATSAGSGKYTVSISNGTGSASNYSISTGGTFTISQKQLAVSSFTYSPLTKVYDGNTNAPSGFTVTATTGSGLVSGDSVTVSYTGAVYNNANVASATTITVSGMTISGTDAGNYSLSATSYAKTGATITKASATCPTVTAYSGTYNASSHTITVSGGAGGTIQYRTSSTGTWTTTKPTRTNAGTTTVYVQVSGDSNHSTVDCGSKNIVISKVTPSITVTPTSGTVEAGDTSTFKATTKSGLNVAGTLTATSGTTSRITITGGDGTSITATSSGVDTTITYKGGTTIGASTVTLTFTPTDSTNFNSATSNFTATNTDTVAPTCSLTSTTDAKSTSQTVTGTIDIGVGTALSKYYFGTSSTGTPETSNTSSTLSSLTANVGGTWYLRVQDEAGNIGSCSIDMVSYTVQTRLLTVTGAIGTYNSTNYALSSTHNYIIPNNSYISRSGSMTTPTGGNSSSYAASIYSNTSSIPSSGTATTVDSLTVTTTNDVVVIWVNRLEYNITVTTSGNGSNKVTSQNNSTGVTASSSSSNQTLKVRYGEKVTATATANTGYSFTGWSGGFVSGTTNPITSGEVTGAKTITASFADTASPSLSLTKTGTVEGFRGWKLSGASLNVSTQELTLNTGVAYSPYIPVDEAYYGWSFDYYPSNAASTYGSNGGYFSQTQYFDSNFALKTGSNGYNANGQSSSGGLNKWNSVTQTNYNYGSGIEYFRFIPAYNTTYSSSQLKMKNMKIYGDKVWGKNYTINVTASDNVGITTRKYASGSRAASYFASSGTAFTGNSITVTANGTYTVYVADAAGNSSVSTITIDRIDTTAPTISTYSGTMLYQDSSFDSSVNGISIYNYSCPSSSCVTITREVVDGSSDYGLKIVNSGNATREGFTWNTQSAANKEFIVYLEAKIPAGYTINFATNQIGYDGYSSGDSAWLTSNVGTGSFQVYVFRVKCGSSGTFSSTNYFWINNGTSSLTWYLRQATVFDTTLLQEPYKFVSIAYDNGAGVAALQVSDSTSEPSSWYESYTNSYGGAWSTPTFGGTKYIWYVDAAGNVASKGVTTGSLSKTINFYVGSTLVGSQSCSNGSTVALKTLSALGGTFPNSGNGWSFAGWNDASNGTAVEYTNGQSITCNSNLNLYAVGSRTFTFYSGTNGASIGSKTQYWNSYSTGTSNYTSITPPTATAISGWSCYGFRGNNTASSTYSAACTGAYKPAPTELTTFAFRTIYVRTLTIDYDGNGATGGNTVDSTWPQYFNSGMNGSGSAISDPGTWTLSTNGFTRANYRFTTWYSNANGTSGTTWAEGATLTWNPAFSDSATKVVYALWIASTPSNGCYQVMSSNGLNCRASMSTTATIKAGLAAGSYYQLTYAGTAEGYSWFKYSGSNCYAASNGSWLRYHSSTCGSSGGTNTQPDPEYCPVYSGSCLCMTITDGHETRSCVSSSCAGTCPYVVVSGSCSTTWVSC